MSSRKTYGPSYTAEASTRHCSKGSTSTGDGAHNTILNQYLEFKTWCHGFYSLFIGIRMALACRVVGPKALATQQRPAPGTVQREAQEPETEHTTQF